MNEIVLVPEFPSVISASPVQVTTGRELAESRGSEDGCEGVVGSGAGSLGTELSGEELTVASTAPGPPIHAVVTTMVPTTVDPMI